MAAYDDQRLPHLAVEMKLIESAMQRNLPVLGICLGGQLVARTLGARVYANHVKEIGWSMSSRRRMPKTTRCSTSSKNGKRSFNGTATPSTSPTGAIHLASSTPLPESSVSLWRQRVRVPIPPRSR